MPATIRVWQGSSALPTSGAPIHGRSVLAVAVPVRRLVVHDRTHQRGIST
jgi:hypothetical protein